MCNGVLVVAITIVGGDAAGVPRKGGGLDLHGVLGPREDSGQQEFTFSQSIVELINQDLDGGSRESGDEACESFVNARVVFGRNRLTWGTEGGAEVTDNGGNQGTTQDAAGDKGGTPKDVRTGIFSANSSHQLDTAPYSLS